MPLRRRRLPVVPAAADRVACGTHQEQHHPNDEYHQANRPQDGDPGDEADDEQNDTENHHGVLL